jgi:hypothetical protein
MSIARFALYAVVASVALARPLAASTLLLTTGGTFNSTTTPITAWSAPGDSWTLSFNTSSTPAVFSDIPGEFFSFFPTNVIYTLNGSTVSGLYSVYFDNAAVSPGSLGGGFSLCFGDATCDGGKYLAAGAQYYTGPESAPTINTIAGSIYTEGSFGTTVLAENDPNGTITISTVSSVPEPSTLVLAFGGAALLALKRFRLGR